MRNEYLRRLQTGAVEAAQVATYGKAARVSAAGSGELRGLSAVEAEFLAERDSFYLSSVSESGWPYVQHRGGAKGFLKVIDERRLAFVDLEGNRQLISVGNVAANAKVSLMVMNYRARERLKVMGRAKVVLSDDEPKIAAALGLEPRSRARIFVIEVVGFNWNCPKFITQRFTREEVDAVVGPLRARIGELETRLEEKG